MEASRSLAAVDQGGQLPVEAVSATSLGAPWIAWQVPSRTVLAATTPGGQRSLLKDALARTLEATGVRLPAQAMNELLGLPQPAALANLERGPDEGGEAALLIRDHAAALGRSRGRLGRL